MDGKESLVKEQAMIYNSNIKLDYIFFQRIIKIKKKEDLKDLGSFKIAVENRIILQPFVPWIIQVLTGAHHTV